MMRPATLIGITLLVLDTPVFAQSADPTAGLDACFRQGRLADKICEAQTDPRARLDCFKKTRDAQLECLTHILPGESTAATPPPQEVAPPFGSASEAPDNPPEQTGSTEQAPPSNNSSSSEGSSAASPTIPKIPATGTEPTTRVQPTPQTIEKNSSPPASRWIISETTSPVDYSPLVTAVLEPNQPGEHGPASLTIGCRAKRVELSLQFRDNSAWRNQSQLYLQIEDHPPTPTDWSWSADGKIATLRNDPVLLLRALPDGSRLKIWTGYQAGHDSAFQLVGLESIRRKISVACNWAPQQTQTSSRKNRTSR
jgi:hypothetical protein